jgi:hypothetical protein
MTWSAHLLATIERLMNASDGPNYKKGSDFLQGNHQPNTFYLNYKLSQLTNNHITNVRTQVHHPSFL